MSRHFAYSVPGLGRFRTNAFYQRSSVALAMRRVRTSVSTFDELRLPDVVRRLSEHHRGLVLVTGPTGSGKTTTLAAMVDHINHVRSCHIITIEDPIEYLHNDDMAAIDQREVGFDTDSFSSAMRTILRQDPDVILVGEMRDPETVHTALTAAETGHLVFSTLHTTTATETVNRIVDFFPPHQQGQVRVSLAGALTGTICQRLIPRADGKGRVPALEIMVVNGRIQQAIMDPVQTSDINEIMAEGEYYGMQTFDQSLVELLPRRDHRPARGHECGLEPARPEGAPRADGDRVNRPRIRGRRGFLIREPRRESGFLILRSSGSDRAPCGESCDHGRSAAHCDRQRNRGKAPPAFLTRERSERHPQTRADHGRRDGTHDGPQFGPVQPSTAPAGSRPKASARCRPGWLPTDPLSTTAPTDSAMPMSMPPRCHQRRSAMAAADKSTAPIPVPTSETVAGGGRPSSSMAARASVVAPSAHIPGTAQWGPRAHATAPNMAPVTSSTTG